MKKALLPGLAICLFISLAAHSGNVNAFGTSKSAPAAAASEVPGSITGTVLETMDSGGYTYMKIDTGMGQPWVAVPQSPAKVGEKVTAMPGMVMKNFTSKTLDRTFDAIVFSGGIAGAVKAPAKGSGMGKMMGGKTGDSFADAIAAEGGAPPTAQQAQAAGSGGSLGAITPFSEIKVDKATGDNAYIVGDVFGKKDSLNGKTVRVHGKVTKFSPMIMKRNWVHIQDGTGDPMNNTHDLVFTTDATVSEGDEITMEGVLAANKDFGSGYKYDAIVEESKVVK